MYVYVYEYILDKYRNHHQVHGYHNMVELNLWQMHIKKILSRDLSRHNPLKQTFLDTWLLTNDGSFCTWPHFDQFMNTCSVPTMSAPYDGIFPLRGSPIPKSKCKNGE